MIKTSTSKFLFYFSRYRRTDSCRFFCVSIVRVKDNVYFVCNKGRCQAAGQPRMYQMTVTDCELHHKRFHSVLLYANVCKLCGSEQSTHKMPEHLKTHVDVLTVDAGRDHVAAYKAYLNENRIDTTDYDHSEQPSGAFVTMIKNLCERTKQFALEPLMPMPGGVLHASVPFLPSAGGFRW